MVYEEALSDAIVVVVVVVILLNLELSSHEHSLLANVISGPLMTSV